MGDLYAVRTSGSLCAYCGAAERVIVETERLLIDRCYVCGDEAMREPARLEVRGRPLEPAVATGTAVVGGTTLRAGTTEP